MEAEGFPRAEETLRLLAAAAGAARLYPSASALPREAAARFVTRSNEIVASGPLRFVVDPHGVRIGETELAAGQSQVQAFAESLHAMQVGQLVIAPGVSEDETAHFVELANMDPASVRAAGGPRALLGRSGVRHIAVIEVSLRASEEAGLLGVDLTTEPLDEIAEQVAAAVERRAREAANGAAVDEMAEAIERLEEATRELAMERVASALMRLDERTRSRVLGLSLTADANGSRMEGMLAVIARMKPAALARLLKLVATQAQTDPRRIAAAMTLPPETAKVLAMLLEPAPDVTPESGVPDASEARLLAEEVAVPEDPAEIQRQVAVASAALSSSRALATATALSRSRTDVETVRAIGDVLPQAARDGAFSTVREALRRLDEIAERPELVDAVEVARTTLSEPAVLRDVCRVALTDADAAIAGEIVHAAGAAGAEALLDSYIRMVEPQRSLMRPVLRGSGETVLGVARSRLRSAPPKVAVGIVRALAALGDRRAAAVIAETLDSSLDEQVRFAAATALANMGTQESVQALVRSLGHREVETQRHIVRELGRIKAAAAVSALARTFDDVSVLAKSYEMRKEIVIALAAIGTPEAEKALRRFSSRIPMFGRKSRELKRLATEAVAQLSTDRGVDAP